MTAVDDVTFREDGAIDEAQIVALYEAQAWSAASKPEALVRALENSDALVTAWTGERLIGLGNTISDGHLVVYYPHLLVAADYRSRGIGGEIVRRLMQKYAGFHQQVVLADANAAAFFRRCGFESAGTTVPLWIYSGEDHG